VYEYIEDLYEELLTSSLSFYLHMYNCTLSKPQVSWGTTRFPLYSWCQSCLIPLSLQKSRSKLKWQAPEAFAWCLVRLGTTRPM